MDDDAGLRGSGSGRSGEQDGSPSPEPVRVQISRKGWSPKRERELFVFLSDLAEDAREWERSEGEALFDITGHVERVRRLLADEATDAQRYREILKWSGRCMSCLDGPPDPASGCTDCLNTGWEGGDPFELIDRLQTENAELRARDGGASSPSTTHSGDTPA